MQPSTISPARTIPPLTPAEVADVATAELAASLALLDRLDPADWAKPTDCAGWTVHDLTAHLVGQYQGMANPVLYLRRHRRAHRRHPELSRLDAHNRQQIEELAGRSGPELVALLAAVGPRGIAARRRISGPMRRLRVGRLYPEEPLPDDRLGYVLEVLGLRDPWLHRVDLARATGRPPVLGGHDGRVVAQVVRDLDRAWAGPPAVLRLTGPAGGSWQLGTGDPVATVRADAVGYLRLLSGRAGGEEPVVDGDPAAAAAATAARVEF